MNYQRDFKPVCKPRPPVLDIFYLTIIAAVIVAVIFEVRIL